MARSPLTNATFTFSGQLLARLLSLAFVAVLARTLGPSLYGDVGLGIALGTVMGVILEPGFNPLLTRDGPEIRSAWTRSLPRRWPTSWVRSQWSGR